MKSAFKMIKTMAISWAKDEYRVSLTIRSLSILFAGLYVVFFYEVAFPWYAYTVKRFVLAFFGYLMYGIGCNFGLFFITTTKAREMKVWATILYIPTFFITPIVVGAFLSYLGIFILFLCSIFVYYYFNPWRKSD